MPGKICAPRLKENEIVREQFVEKGEANQNSGHASPDYQKRKPITLLVNFDFLT